MSLFRLPACARTSCSSVAPLLCVAALCTVLAACTPAPSSSSGEDSRQARVPARSAAVVTPWTLPAPAGAGQPDLATSPEGDLLLSWVEPGAADTHRLRLSSMSPTADARWQPALTVAEGRKWFLNWADTPHVYALPDGSLWAHWLRSTGPARMDYGIDLVRSGDGGRSWSTPTLVHPAGTRGDHGFVTFWTQGPDQLGLAWLDSRQKAAAMAAGPSHDDAHHGGGAPMMLRAALYGSQATQQAEWPLDASTCDCCTTASAMTDRGAVVVYRGRDADEIRDTRIVRFDGKAWTSPRDVHADGWRIAGCPVNGPVVVARGMQVWVAWYTEADGLPELRAARSDDAGDRFGEPVTLARGPQVLGRLSLALARDRLLAAWLETADNAPQRIVLGRYDLHWRDPERVIVAPIDARGRASGLPRVRWAGQAAWLVWTDVADGRSILRGASVR